MANQQHSFKLPLITLYRNDLEMALGFTPAQAEQVTDEDMKSLAEFIKDSYEELIGGEIQSITEGVDFESIRKITHSQ